MNISGGYECIRRSWGREAPTTNRELKFGMGGIKMHPKPRETHALHDHLLGIGVHIILFWEQR